MHVFMLNSMSFSTKKMKLMPMTRNKSQHKYRAAEHFFVEIMRSNCAQSCHTWANLKLSQKTRQGWAHKQHFHRFFTLSLPLPVSLSLSLSLVHLPFAFPWLLSCCDLLRLLVMLSTHTHMVSPNLYAVFYNPSSFVSFTLGWTPIYEIESMRVSSALVSRVPLLLSFYENQVCVWYLFCLYATAFRLTHFSLG